MRLAALLRDLADLLAPGVCARCRARLRAGEPGACEACLGALPVWPPQRCALCAEGGASAPGAACTACAPSGTDGAPLAAGFAALAYAGETEAWMRRFKYPGPGLLGLDPAPVALLAAALGRALAPARVRAAPGDRVVPIPLHPRRLRERGFSPAGVLARSAAHSLGLAFDPALLVRVRDTPSQTGLDRRARRRNVADAFRVRPGASTPARVWLVDDVVTTGATWSEAARTLRRAGAGEVIGVCVARTPFAR